MSMIDVKVKINGGHVTATATEKRPFDGDWVGGYAEGPYVIDGENRPHVVRVDDHEIEPRDLIERRAVAALLCAMRQQPADRRQGASAQ